MLGTHRAKPVSVDSMTLFAVVLIKKRLFLEVSDIPHQNPTMYNNVQGTGRIFMFEYVCEISHVHIYKETSYDLNLTLGNFVWLS